MNIKGWYLRFLGKNRHKEIPIETVKSVILLTAGRLGDALVVTPLIRQLKTARKDIQLTVISSPVSSVIFQNNPFIDELIIKDFQHAMEKEFKKRWVTSYDVAIIPLVSINPKIIKAIKNINAKNYYMYKTHAKYGVTSQELGMATKTIEYFKAGPRVKKLNHFLTLFNISEELQGSYDLFNIENDSVEKILLTKSVIGICPEASAVMKNITLEALKELLKTLESKSREVEIVILVEPHRCAFYSEALKEFGNNIAVLQTDTIGQLDRIVSQCCLIISVDTLTLHLAARHNIKTIGFYFEREEAEYNEWESIATMQTTYYLPTTLEGFKHLPIKSIEKVVEKYLGSKE